MDDEEGMEGFQLWLPGFDPIDHMERQYEGTDWLERGNVPQHLTNVLDAFSL